MAWDFNLSATRFDLCAKNGPAQGRPYRPLRSRLLLLPRQPFMPGGPLQGYEKIGGIKVFPKIP